MISRSPLPALSETITSLYAALRMVWTISRYYNTEDRLLPLMHRIAKHITARVRSSINIKELFSSSSRNAAILSGLAGQNFYGQGAIEALATNASEALGSSTFMDAGRRSLTKVSSSQIIPTTSTSDNYTPIDILHAAGQVLTKWKAQYNETKQKIEESTTDTKRWELDKRVLFGETDFHLARVETLIGCVQSVMEFSQIISPDVQRVMGINLDYVKSGKLFPSFRVSLLRLIRRFGLRLTLRNLKRSSVTLKQKYPKRKLRLSHILTGRSNACVMCPAVSNWLAV